MFRKLLLCLLNSITTVKICNFFLLSSFVVASCSLVVKLLYFFKVVFAIFRLIIHYLLVYDGFMCTNAFFFIIDTENVWYADVRRGKGNLFCPFLCRFRLTFYALWITLFPIFFWFWFIKWYFRSILSSGYAVIYA